MTVRAVATLAVVVVLATAGCGGSDLAGAGPSGVGGKITVFAAASLTEPFSRIGEDFQAAHPGTTVTFSFAGSSTLATQINQGAPADVFASANPANMDLVTEAGNAAGAATTFVRNQLVIAVPAGNPLGITGLADLTGQGVKVAICAEQVPCGTAAKVALDAAGVALTPVTLEQDVKAALSKVELGEVDAALVYRTDARAGEGVAGIEFPASDRAVNDYPIAVLQDAPNPAGGQAFVDYVRSDGMAVLTGAGFQEP